MVKSRPKIILSAAVSVDGKIATRTHRSNLSSRKDKVRLHRLRSKVDAILVGKNTVKIDDPLLTVRYVRGKNPTRIVLDSRAEISTRSKIIRTSHKVPTIIVVSDMAPQRRLDALARYPVQIMRAGKAKVDLKRMFSILKKQNIMTVLAEGGGTLNWELVRQGLVDEMIITVTPYVVGGRDATTLVEGSGFTKITKRFTLEKITRQKDEVVLYYI
jgi:2,5-diamino-6-(ribosylamino)-4(3H)-pyrimidinone 5'-phosphate reductase